MTDIRNRFKQMAANQINCIRSFQFNWNWKISWKQTGWKINQYLTLLINGCLNKMTMHTNKVACSAYHPSNWIESTRIEENLMWSNSTRQKDGKNKKWSKFKHRLVRPSYLLFKRNGYRLSVARNNRVKGKHCSLNSRSRMFFPHVTQMCYPQHIVCIEWNFIVDCGWCTLFLPMFLCICSCMNLCCYFPLG